jgi:hypothetical protein
MKNDKLIYSIGAIVIIIGSVMKIFHLPYANTVLISDFIVIFFYQNWHVTQLKKRIKELEDKRIV